ncbi:MAG: hypothetical protein EPO40_06120 [Myxococcaceae bacterium]|nr:MAG: hypothetical protein EPO40_06120 [Myxococcaceae bacterium]
MTMQIHQENSVIDTERGLARTGQSAAMQRISDLMPRSYADMAMLGKWALKSGLAKVETEEAAIILMMTGMELGLTPMQSLRGIYSVEGRPFLSSDTMVALIWQSGLCELWEVVETTEAIATIRAKRHRGQEITRSFTRADAETAGLIKSKGGHEKYPRTMLLHRAVAVVARELFPDVILGMYVPEEQAEIVQTEVIRPRVVEAKESQPLARAPFTSPQNPQPAAPARDWDAEIAAAETLDVLKAIGADLKETKATRSAEEGTRLGGLFQARKKVLVAALQDLAASANDAAGPVAFDGAAK